MPKARPQRLQAAPAEPDDLLVWKALADPTRRRILDLLREGPRTTGDLAEQFALTRFGVMKHLGVLTEAGLVTVRREGRNRWNALNPMPIHQISRRWIRSFETAAADRLLRLKHHAEEGDDAMHDTAEFRSLDIRLELEIAAGPEKVWASLTTGIGEWWPAKFYVGTSPKRFTLEPKVGGRVYEDWGDGEGALWGTVNAYEENTMLQWAGDMSADFGGPARSLTTFRLAKGKKPGTTALSFRDTPYGMLSDTAVEHLEAGWQWLLGDCLKPWAEAGKRPERPASVEGA